MNTLPTDTDARDFEARVADAVSRHALLRPGAPVIVAVSGGADSVALLCALEALGYQCVVAHCNFHLRGAESDRDMRYVQQLSGELGVDLYVREFDVDARCRQTGESVEMACRELRYSWFGDLLDKLRAQAVAVAHHREDNVETFFLNLLRGSGLSGLTGMRPRNGYVVRPMLGLSRADIEGYLRGRGVEWVDDSTNAECEYARNRLRNLVLPALEQAFPGAMRGVLASMSCLADNRALYDALVGECASRYVGADGIRLADMMREYPDQARMLLFEAIRQWGFNMTHVDNIIASAQRSGLRFSAGRTTLALNRGHLSMVSRTGYTPDEVEVTLRRDILSPVAIGITEHHVAEFKPERDPSVAYFDVSVLEGDPVFALRRWRRGDRITPYGMRGTRLVSDVFSDAKLSVDDKRNVWLLTRDGEIIWVVGIRATARFAVTPATRRYICLRLLS